MFLEVKKTVFQWLLRLFSAYETFACFYSLSQVDRDRSLGCILRVCTSSPVDTQIAASSAIANVIQEQRAWFGCRNFGFEQQNRIQLGDSNTNNYSTCNCILFCFAWKYTVLIESFNLQTTENHGRNSGQKNHFFSDLEPEIKPSIPFQVLQTNYTRWLQ